MSNIIEIWPEIYICLCDLSKDSDDSRIYWKFSFPGRDLQSLHGGSKAPIWSLAPGDMGLWRKTRAIFSHAGFSWWCCCSQGQLMAWDREECWCPGVHRLVGYTALGLYVSKLTAVKCLDCYTVMGFDLDCILYIFLELWYIIYVLDYITCIGVWNFIHIHQLDFIIICTDEYILVYVCCCDTGV